MTAKEERGEVLIRVGRLIEGMEDLSRRVDDNCKASVDGDKTICNKLDVISRKHADDFERHEVYHRKHEQGWGIWTLLKKKPWLAMVLGAMVLTSLGLTFRDLVRLVLRVFGIVF